MKQFFKMFWTVPNAMSLFRIASAPLLAVFWLGLEWRVTALAIGTLSGITDLVDGWVARKLGRTTDLGALLDQLGDLVFESTCLIIAMAMGEMWSGWIFIYLFREFTISAIRSYMAALGGSLPSTVIGKAKSSYVQWSFFGFFLGGILIQPGIVPESWSLVGVTPGRMLIWISMLSIITGIGAGLLSGWIYLKAFAKFYLERQSAKTG